MFVLPFFLSFLFFVSQPVKAQYPVSNHLDFTLGQLQRCTLYSYYCLYSGVVLADAFQ